MRKGRPIYRLALYVLSSHSRSFRENWDQRQFGPRSDEHQIHSADCKTLTDWRQYGNFPRQEAGKLEVGRDKVEPKFGLHSLGHSSIVITLDRYGRLFPRGSDRAELANTRSRCGF